MGSLLKTFEGHQIFLISVAFTPDGNMIVIGSIDNKNKLLGKCHDLK